MTWDQEMMARADILYSYLPDEVTKSGKKIERPTSLVPKPRNLGRHCRQLGAYRNDVFQILQIMILLRRGHPVRP